MKLQARTTISAMTTGLILCTLLLSVIGRGQSRQHFLPEQFARLKGRSGLEKLYTVRPVPEGAKLQTQKKVAGPAIHRNFDWININAVGISGNGKMVVGILAGQAVRWDENSGVQPLPYLKPSFPNSYAAAASYDGSVICGASQVDTIRYGPNIAAVMKPVYWQNGSGPIELPTGAYTGGWAFDVDSAGLVISGEAESLYVKINTSYPFDTTIGIALRPCRWIGGALIFEAGTDTFRTCWSSGISADGSTTVGFYETHSEGIPQAAKWPTGSFVDLGIHSPPTYTWATASSRHGDTIAGQEYMDGVGPGMRWTAGAGWVALSDSEIPYAISYDGATMVGRSTRMKYTADVGHSWSTMIHGAVWRNRKTNFEDLNTICRQELGIPLTNGMIFEAIAVSADGKTILALGADDANHGPFCRIVLEKMITITTPTRDTLWVAGDTSTIRWNAVPGIDSVNIYYSVDSGITLRPVALKASANAGSYSWLVPDTIMSAKCMVVIRASADTTIAATSALFKIRGLYLTRLNATRQYEKYNVTRHSFWFENRGFYCFPQRWWSLFDYKSGIDPNTSAKYPAETPFSIADPSDFPDWPLWVHTFGGNQCYDRFDDEGYKIDATEVWGQLKGSWHGSCAGFAVGSLMAFTHPDNLRAGFPEMPSFTDLYTQAYTDSVRDVVNMIWLHQFDLARVNYVTSVGDTATPMGTVSLLKKQFLSDAAQPSALLLTNNNGSGGHVLVPYRLRTTGVSGFYAIAVYDCNHPGDTTLEIFVNGNDNGGAGSWYYGSLPSWGGDKYFSLSPPADSWYPTPVIPLLPVAHKSPLFAAQSVYSGFFDSYVKLTSNVTITDSLGRKIGYQGGAVSREIPGATVKMMFTGQADPPYGYLLPPGNYTFAIDHSTDTASSLLFRRDSILFVYRHFNADSTQHDRLVTGPGGGIRAQNDDGTPRTIELKMDIEDPGAKKLFSASNLSFSQNDSVTIRPLGRTGFTLSHDGPDTLQFDLKLRYLTPDGPAIFTRSGIHFVPNAGYQIAPDWNLLGYDTLLTIRIDHGNKGSYDDSVVIINQTQNHHPPVTGATMAVRNDLWVTDSPVNAIARSGNTIYIGGDFTHVSQYTGYFSAFDTISGQADPTFPVVGGPVLAVTPDGSGGWYIGGSFSRVGPVMRSYIAHINADRSVDTLWRPSCNDAVHAIAVSGSTVYVGGDFNVVGGKLRNYLAALDRVTGAATSWNPSPSNSVLAIRTSNGVVYVGGNFFTIGGQSRSRLAAIDSATSLATSWNPAPNSGVTGIALSGTTLYAIGNFSNIGGQARYSVAALDTGLGSARSWNPVVDNVVNTIVVTPSRIYLGGRFTSVNGVSQPRLTAVDPVNGSTVAWNPSVNNYVTAMSIFGPNLCISGYFTQVGGQGRQYLAAVDTLTGAPTGWNPSPNSTANAFDFRSGILYIGGNFGSVGAVTRNYIAALDALTGKPTTWDPSADNSVKTLSFSETTVYAGGDFTSIGGATRNHIAALDSTTGQATGWDPNANQSVNTIIAAGQNIFAGGPFTSIGGQSRNHVAVIDAGSGSATPFDCHLSGPIVDALAISGSKLFVGGMFDSLNGAARQNLGAVDLQSGATFSWNPGANSEVRTFAITGQTIYAGGNFTSIGGQQHSYIASLDINSGMVNGWNPTPGSFVMTVGLSGGSLYAGGGFNTINGEGHFLMGAISRSTGHPTSWDPRFNGGYLNSVCVYGPMVYVGGHFNDVGYTGRPYFTSFFDSAVVTTGVKEHPPSADLPSGFRLEQNYPNPFNPVTTIAYQIPAASRVRLIIYNILGQAVTTLVDNIEQPGYKTVRWNASSISSGVYFYRLEATPEGKAGKPFWNVKKMLFLK